MTSAQVESLLLGDADNDAIAAAGARMILDPEDEPSRTVAEYVDSFAGDLPAMEPAKCAESATPLVLVGVDGQGDGTIYFGPPIMLEEAPDGVSSTADQYIRYFASVEESKEFFDSYRSALTDCPDFRFAADDGQGRVARSVSNQSLPVSAFSVTETIEFADGETGHRQAWVLQAGNAVAEVSGRTNDDSQADVYRALGALIAQRMEGKQDSEGATDQTAEEACDLLVQEPLLDAQRVLDLAYRETSRGSTEPISEVAASFAADVTSVTNATVRSKADVVASALSELATTSDAMLREGSQDLNTDDLDSQIDAVGEAVSHLAEAETTCARTVGQGWSSN